jgi:hypothetical protein
VLKEKRQKNRRKISVDDDNEKLQFQREQRSRDDSKETMFVSYC